MTLDAQVKNLQVCYPMVRHSCHDSAAISPGNARAPPPHLPSSVEHQAVAEFPAVVQVWCVFPKYTKGMAHSPSGITLQ